MTSISFRLSFAAGEVDGVAFVSMQFELERTSWVWLRRFFVAGLARLSSSNFLNPKFARTGMVFL